MSKLKKVLMETAVPAVKAAKEISVPAVDTAKKIADPRFSKALDLSVNAIKDGTDEYKRECVTRVENRRGTALIYSAVFAALALIYLCVYGLINSYSALQEAENPLGKLHVVSVIMPVIIIPSIVAVFMKVRAIVLTIALYAMIAAYFIVVWHLLAVVPFAIAGCVVFIRLSKVLDAYYTLIGLDGYPDFMPLSKDIIDKNHAEKNSETPS